MFQHSVQHMPVRGAASASTARKMINNTSVASHIINTTVYDVQITEQVAIRVSLFDDVVCGVPVREDSIFYLVASKFAHRFYVVALVDGQYRCSASDERVVDRCIAKVVCHRNRRMAA